MVRSRVALISALAILILLLGKGVSIGWEFRLSGNCAFIFSHYSQLGSNGFFGPYDVDLSATGDYASNNGWLGPQSAGDLFPPGGASSSGLVSGADASRSSVVTLLFPSLIVNPAVTLQGVYRLGSAETTFFPGSTVAFGNGEWLQWWASVNSPLGLVVFGKRPFQFGAGLQFDSGSRTQEQLALVSYCGPLSIGLGLYPWRVVPRLNDLGERVPWSIYDKNGFCIWDIFYFVNYSAGPVETGVVGTFYSYHIGPEGTRTTADRITTSPLDVYGTEGGVYFKYNNGRFFFNAETDWNYRKATWQSSLMGTFKMKMLPGPLPQDYAADIPGGGGNLFRPQYTEAWRWMVELGWMCGPGKLSLLYSVIPGPDRRHGQLNDRQSVLADLYLPNYVDNNPDLGNNVVFRPYSLLLSQNYGSGVNALNRAGDGYMLDAKVFAARLDYAVAANLNTFGTFLYARRESRSGYSWGYIRPNVGVVAPEVSFYTPPDMNSPGVAFTAPVPSIPDDELGWEVTTGLEWQILNSTNVNVTAAYWQPGRWFNYACRSRAVPVWNTAPAPANNWGVNPDRTIDAIFGLLVTARIDI
ncbi:MAG: hypothetical protein ACLQPD_30485 [Desulfomonilaceae bacterium]